MSLNFNISFFLHCIFSII